jgi:anti-sigma-K factor RskA
MRYERPELLEPLAAEYVLGTLRGAPRRRFERLYRVSAAARARVQRWEDDLGVISAALAPVPPAARVWSALEQRLFGAGAAPPRPRRWRLALAAAAVVAIGLLVGVLVREQQRARLETLAVLGPDVTHALWRIERPRRLTSLTIRTVGSVQSAAGKAYELWALPRGGKPVSLGVLPASGTLERPLSGAQSAALLAADKLAVSVEPSGGSPSGAPTGPIVIVVNVAAAAPG